MAGRVEVTVMATTSARSDWSSASADRAASVPSESAPRYCGPRSAAAVSPVFL